MIACDIAIVGFGRMWTYCLTSNNNQHKSKYGNGKQFIFGKWKAISGGGVIRSIEDICARNNKKQGYSTLYAAALNILEFQKCGKEKSVVTREALEC